MLLLMSFMIIIFFIFSYIPSKSEAQEFELLMLLSPTLCWFNIGVFWYSLSFFKWKSTSSSDESSSSDEEVDINLKNERLYQKTPIFSQENVGESSIMSSNSMISDLDEI